MTQKTVRVLLHLYDDHKGVDPVSLDAVSVKTKIGDLYPLIAEEVNMHASKFC